jgi:hypothetical protein
MFQYLITDDLVIRTCIYHDLFEDFLCEIRLGEYDVILWSNNIYSLPGTKSNKDGVDKKQLCNCVYLICNIYIYIYIYLESFLCNQIASAWNYLKWEDTWHYCVVFKISHDSTYR